MSTSSAEHRATSPQKVRCAVVTVSDTRTLENDTGGRTVIDLLTAAGYDVTAREIIPDEPARMRPLLEEFVRRDDVDAVLLTGGTGLSSRDQTYETVTSLLTKPLPGYGEIFRLLSFQEIGPAGMLSRATAGLIGQTVVFTMPGSPGGVRLAMERLIAPELAHVVREARR
ncbi:MAG: MogA/MoaB family molybdenum cofactor biosynthesis protein [Pirellulales bacterium]